MNINSEILNLTNQIQEHIKTIIHHGSVGFNPRNVKMVQYMEIHQSNPLHNHTKGEKKTHVCLIRC
jgi:ArsR family metal-binding transcriptional regulator